MTIDWKALCVELVDIATAHCNPDDSAVSYCAAVLLRARTALSQPEPEEPSDRIISIAMAVQECASAWEPTAQLIGDVCAEDIADLCGAVLARCGRPAVEPVPVTERPWEREGWCDAEWRCWWGRPSGELCNSDWFLATRAEVEEFCDLCSPTVSLPYYALPVPTTKETP